MRKAVVSMKHLISLLALSYLALSCSDSDSPRAFCPTIGDQGPALGTSGAYLLVAGSLSEDWRAVGISGPDPVVFPGNGLTGQAPNDLDVVQNRLYTVNSLDNTVSMIDLETGRTDGCIEVGTGANPWEFFPDPSDPSRAWLTTFAGGDLLELDLDFLSVRRRIPVGPALEGLLVTDTHVVVTLTGFDLGTYSYGEGTVVVFDKASLVEVVRFAVPTNPQFVLAGADGRTHVVCTGNFGFPDPGIFGKIVRIESDWSAVRDTLEIGGSPARAAVDADGVAYLASFFGGVLAYDTLAFEAIHDVADPLLGDAGFTDVFAFAGNLYAANFEADKVVRMNLASSITTDILLPTDGPAALAVREGVGTR